MKLPPSLNIKDLELSMSIEDKKKGGYWAYSRYSHNVSKDYYCQHCLSNLDAPFVITWKLWEKYLKSVLIPF